LLSAKSRGATDAKRLPKSGLLIGKRGQTFPIRRQMEHHGLRLEVLHLVRNDPHFLASIAPAGGIAK
jgi:hypothetical protein